MTLDRLADTPAAQGILRTIAWWAPERIPQAYLDGLTDPLDLIEGLRRLAAYSMITLHGDTISVHRLVQAITRTADPESTLGIRNYVVNWLHRLCPKGTFWGEAAQVWATHVEAMASHTPADSDDQELATLFIEAGLRLARGAPTRSLALCRRGIAGMERHAGVDQGGTFHAGQVMAHFHAIQGHDGQAIPLLEQLLEESVDRFGADDPTTFRWRDVLLAALSTVDPAKAEVLARESVEHATRVLGPDDRMTIHFRLKLDELTSPDPDLPALETRIANASPVLGEDDPVVAALQRRRLHELVRTGDTEGAVALAESLVKVHGSALGNLDPTTIELRVAHINLLLQAGKKEHARRLYSTLWEECLQAADGPPKNPGPLQHFLSLSRPTKNHRPGQQEP